MTNELMKPNEDVSRRFLKAVADEDVSEAERLLQAGADVNSTTVLLADANSIESIGTPAITLAIPNLEMVRLLLEHGADPNKYDGRGHSPLDDAIVDGVIEIVKTLIHYGADVNQPSAAMTGITPLMAALWDRQVEIAKLLLRYGANPTQCWDSDNNLYAWATRADRLKEYQEAGL